ncbi:MAG: hypothetical protein GX442_23830 [Candidatus Riflebacteria bacterium]|nr:hypothetical protein [Candidatus Riflebacteria bacterium]
MEPNTPRPAEQQVIAQAGQLAEVLRLSSEWADTCVKQAQLKGFLLKTIHGRRLTVGKIQESARRPVALGVFGASQCGKSYLVSEMVKGGAATLEVFVNAAGGPEQKRDFLEEINPAGGRESTAVVTRFTRRPYVRIPGCAAVIRLLKRVDVIKILINGFLFECQSEFAPSAEDLQKLRYSFRGVQRSRGGDAFALTEEEVWDLQDYVKRHFRSPFLKMLEDINYWGILNDEVRHLPGEYQVSYLEWLWGKFTRLTDLYRQLAQALAGIGGEFVGISEEALVPRQQSIIDVQRLATLMQSGNRKCPIVLADGRRVDLDASILCALTCELILRVPPGPAAGLLDEMDVLDFPGARARAQVYDNHRLVADAAALPEVFLRGKVACLFDRFSDDRDITALVLCQEGGPQEAKSLPYMINKWVDWSTGAEPADRRGKPVLLFHVFTKFDMDLVRKKGEDPNVRWESRLATNFADFFGRAGEWPLQWDDAQAFRNCFWVRNPNVQQTVFGKDRDGKEFVRDEQQLAEIKAQYLAHPLVKRHFADPGTAWDRAAAPGQAGIPWLIERIRAAVAPDAKARQLADNLRQMLAELKTNLRPYFVGDDTVKNRAAAEERANRLLDALGGVMPTHFSLPLLLDRDRFCLSEKTVAMLYDAIVNPMSDEDESGAGDAAAAPEPPKQPAFRPDIFKRPGAAAAPAAASGTSAPAGTGSGGQAPATPKGPLAQPLTRGEQFARSVFSRWQEQMVALSGDAETHRLTGLPPEWFAEVTQELLKGAARLQVFQAIGAASNVALTSPGAGKFMPQRASATAAQLNRFVTGLGRPAPEKPLPQGVLKASLTAEAYPGLPIYLHWIDGFVQLCKDNAAGGQEVDERSNALLAKILGAGENG